MPASPRTTTSPPAPQFEPPELVVDEALLAKQIALPLGGDNFNKLITANFQLTMVARDRKVKRDIFQDIVVTAFNFQNRLVRLAELSDVIHKLTEGGGFSLEEVQEEIKGHYDEAKAAQLTLKNALALFREMRGPEDPVS